MSHLNFSFIMIYIIDKMLVLLKNHLNFLKDNILYILLRAYSLIIKSNTRKFKNLKNLENLKTKYVKVQADIKFIKLCKQEKLIPTFVNIKLSLKRNNKLKKLIPRIVMETEIENKHRDKKSFKEEIRQKCILLKSTLGIVVFNVLLHHLNNVIKRKKAAILLRHLLDWTSTYQQTSTEIPLKQNLSHFTKD